MDWFTNPKHGEAKKWVPQGRGPENRDRAAQDLIRLGADAVPALMEALQTQDLNLLAIYQQILARIPSASPVLITALRTAHPLIRGRVADVFGINKDKNAIPVLLEALRGEFFTVRARAALALGNIGEPKVLPQLLPLLKDTEDETRIAACEAIGKFKDPSTFDDLANVVLEDPLIEVRQAALRSLGASRHPDAIPFLMEALRDSFWWLERDQAASELLNAIEQMGQPVVEPLIEALSDREGTVRKFAVMILGRLRDNRALDELGMALYDLHHEVSQAAAEALARYGGEAIGVLSEALTHPEAGVRERAVYGLGMIPDSHVIHVLAGLADDQEREVRRQVLLSLGRFNDPQAKKLIEAFAADRGDRELAGLAKQILAKMERA